MASFKRLKKGSNVFVPGRFSAHEYIIAMSNVVLTFSVFVGLLIIMDNLDIYFKFSGINNFVDILYTKR